MAMAGAIMQLGFTTVDYGKGSIGLACAAGVAIYDALTKGGDKPALVGAALVTMMNLAIGVHVCTAERPHRTVAFVNYCTCFFPLIIAMAHGGEFKPEIAEKIRQALA